MPPDRRAEARETVADVLRSVAFGARERAVRINALDGDAWERDLAALPLECVDLIVVPKVERPERLRALDAALEGRSVRLILSIETPRGLFAALPIADASPRCAGLFFGPGDYTMQTGGALTEQALHVPRALIAAAAGAAGVQAIDAPYLLAIKDVAATRADALAGRALGYSGKVVFHPAQIAPINDAFSPTAAEVAQARTIVRAYRDAAARGEAVAYAEGAFIAPDLVPRMERVIAVAAALEEQEPR